MKRISRRNFLKAMGISATALTLAACGGSSSSTAAGTAGSTAASAVATGEPKAGGTLRLCYSSPIATPGYTPRATNNASIYYLTLSYESLTSYDAEGNMIPNLATEWDVNTDELSITWTLREGVNFADGEPFNAEAVKRNIEEYQANNRTETANIASCEVIDDTHIKMMLAKGVSVEDARDYCMMGCVEPQKSGRLYQWTSTSYTQWPICIELTLNHGIPLWYGKQVTPDLGDPAQYHTYEEFDAAVKKTIYYVTKWTDVATVISQRVARDVAPKPLMSIMYEGCMEHGKDVSAGGAMYNYGPGVVWTGLATYADSMAAIKKLVFDEHKYTLTQMFEAMKADFEGYDQLRKDCLDAPKYGNDDDYADDIAADIIDYTEHIHLDFKTLYSHMSTGTLSISNNTPFGEMTGATANGRKAWTPLSDGISPTQGADFRGPTAIIKSVSKLSNDSMNIGMVHNFKLMSGLLDTPEGENGLITLLRTASMFGNGEMQFNYLDNKTLIDAQKHPENHRDLVVRVAGYSAFFNELCKDVQDEIISRTMLNKF